MYEVPLIEPEGWCNSESPLVCHSALPTIIHEEADYTYLQTAVIF